MTFKISESEELNRRVDNLYEIVLRARARHAKTIDKYGVDSEVVRLRSNYVAGMEIAFRAISGYTFADYNLMKRRNWL